MTDPVSKGSPEEDLIEEVETSSNSDGPVSPLKSGIRLPSKIRKYLFSSGDGFFSSMRHDSYRAKFFWFLGFLQIGAGSMIVVITALMKVSVGDWQSYGGLWKIAADNIAEIQTFDSPIIFVCTVILGLLKLWRTHLGDPKTWKLVHNLLDELKDLAFTDRNNSDDNIPYDRVTLFKAVRFRWFRAIPGTRWLVPIERSGHLNRNTKVSFPIPDNGEAEGVAGKTWARNKVVAVSGLKNATSSERALNWYAKGTYVSADWLQRTEKHQAKAFLGIPVEVNGIKWGVLVFDSRGDEKIENPNVDLMYFKLTGILSKVLERV